MQRSVSHQHFNPAAKNTTECEREREAWLLQNRLLKIQIDTSARLKHWDIKSSEVNSYFTPKTFFLLSNETVVGGGGWGVNVQQTKITPAAASFWELNIPSCSELQPTGDALSARSVPLGQGHQVGVHLALCQNPGGDDGELVKL